MTADPARVRTKICCISTLEEAALAIAAGADGLGLVAEMPSGTGVISLARAAEIAAFAPPGVATFMLTSKSRAPDIVAEACAVRPAVVQIVAHVDPAEYPALRAGLPGVRLVQAVHVEEREATLARAALYAGLADAILLDSGRPGAPVAELGGTGRTHDWAVSREVVARATKPVYLAGGLKPGNVGAAIAAVRPFGVDVCTGLRSEGRLDAEKLAAFIAAVRAIG